MCGKEMWAGVRVNVWVSVYVGMCEYVWVGWLTFYFKEPSKVGGYRLVGVALMATL